jgi:hypothetical protein
VTIYCGALQNFLAESAGNVGARKLEIIAQALYLAVNRAGNSEMWQKEVLNILHQVLTISHFIHLFRTDVCAR